MIIVAATNVRSTPALLAALAPAGLLTLGDAGGGSVFFQRGANRSTNPHPVTGRYLHPDALRQVVVGLTPGAVCTTDFGYIERAAFVLGAWDQHPPEAGGRVPGPLAWFQHVHALLRDAMTRRYPFSFHSARRVRDDESERVALARWLGAERPDDVGPQVSPDPDPDPDPDPGPDPGPEPAEARLAPALRSLLDDVSRAVDEGAELDAEVVHRMNATMERLFPELLRARQAALQQRLRRTPQT